MKHGFSTNYSTEINNFTGYIKKEYIEVNVYYGLVVPICHSHLHTAKPC